MPVTLKTGDIFNSSCDFIVIPTNTRGVMGAGLALDARNRWKSLGPAYMTWCRRGNQRGGDIYIHWPDMVICLCTKEDFRNASRLEWIERGLGKLRRFLEDDSDNESAALPMLGCGLGGLPMPVVEEAVQLVFGDEEAPMVELWRTGKER